MDNFFEPFDKIPGTVYSRDPESLLGRLFQLLSEKFDSLSSERFDSLRKVIRDELMPLKEISSQSGQVLDEIGEIVREPRKGREDDVYRNFLYIAIQRNISNGSLSTMTGITRLIIGDEQVNSVVVSEQNVVNEDYFLDPEGNTVFLDGSRLLDPYDARPATFKVSVTGETAGIDGNYLQSVVDELKGAGIEGLVDVE
jgi:hypothetical protein